MCDKRPQFDHVPNFYLRSHLNIRYGTKIGGKKLHLFLYAIKESMVCVHILKCPPSLLFLDARSSQALKKHPP